MTGETRKGYYKDRHGKWQIDRRKGDRDRRAGQSDAESPEARRRRVVRRQEDRERLEADHRHMIDEALEDFAEEHDGHL